MRYTDRVLAAGEAPSVGSVGDAYDNALAESVIDKSDGPTAGTETVDPLECLARVLVHIPDKGHVTTRYRSRGQSL